MSCKNIRMSIRLWNKLHLEKLIDIAAFIFSRMQAANLGTMAN